MKRRILIVDDEKEFTHLARVTLESLGNFKVIEENDATAALATARREEPELILLDIMMPQIDGGELAALLANDPQLRHIPIIFLSALVTQEETCEGGSYSAGGRIYFPKPVNWTSLIQRMEQCLSQGRQAVVVEYACNPHSTGR